MTEQPLQDERLKEEDAAEFIGSRMRLRTLRRLKVLDPLPEKRDSGAFAFHYLPSVLSNLKKCLDNGDALRKKGRVTSSDSLWFLKETPDAKAPFTITEFGKGRGAAYSIKIAAKRYGHPAERLRNLIGVEEGGFEEVRIFGRKNQFVLFETDLRAFNSKENEKPLVASIDTEKWKTNSELRDKYAMRGNGKPSAGLTIELGQCLSVWKKLGLVTATVVRASRTGKAPSKIEKGPNGERVVTEFQDVTKLYNSTRYNAAEFKGLWESDLKDDVQFAKDLPEIEAGITAKKMRAEFKAMGIVGRRFQRVMRKAKIDYDLKTDRYILRPRKLTPPVAPAQSPPVKPAAVPAVDPSPPGMTEHRLAAENAKPSDAPKLGLRPTAEDRKQAVLSTIAKLGTDTNGNHASFKKIVSAMYAEGCGERLQTTRGILRELKTEGKYKRPM